MTIKEYQRKLEIAAAETREEIQRALTKKRRGSKLRRLNKALEDIEAALKRLAKVVGSIAPLVVLARSLSGLNEKTSSLEVQLRRQADLISRRTVLSSQAHIQDAITRVREATREVRQEGLIRGWLHDGLSPQQAVDRLAEYLAGPNGAPGDGMIYKNGKVVPYDTYARMAVRTAINQAANMSAIGVSMSEWGEGVVKMSTHFPTCAVCAPLQGRYYRTMDFPPEDERSMLPHISAAFRGWPEFDNVHPNCRHVVVSINWLRLPESGRKKALAEAGRPTDIDSRSQREIDAYNAEQKQKAQLLADQRQYARYRAVLGEDAPKTLASFRRMKYNNSPAWNVMQAYYRSVTHGDLTPLMSYSGYMDIRKDIEKQLIGIVTKNGIEIAGYSDHFVDRVIGSVEQRRSGVPVEAVRDTLLNPGTIDEIQENANGRSQKFLGDVCVVTVNPDTANLIQTNLNTRRRRKHG